MRNGPEFETINDKVQDERDCLANTTADISAHVLVSFIFGIAVGVLIAVVASHGVPR